jgi:hypothetical protein
MSRRADIDRETAETRIHLELGLDGTGVGERRTGVGFLDHMLDLLARHGRLDLVVDVSGDLHTGAHHTVEDTGLALGRALDQALVITACSRAARRSRRPARPPAAAIASIWRRPTETRTTRQKASSAGVWDSSLTPL